MGVTRGTGLLEGFLARQRAKAANRLIPPALRGGRILDMGCGSFPLFLSGTDFSEKYGIESAPSAPSLKGIKIIDHDLGSAAPLPFADEFFDAVTMLAVFEHIEKERLPGLLREVRRILKRGGLFVLTTPAPWTDKLLRAMAALGLVSREEIEEHKDAYGHSEIRSILDEAGFEGERLRLGYFEAFLNVWAAAEKG